MGIRYYAYAVASEMFDEAVADPLRLLSRDPLADAWGLEPGATVGELGQHRRVPERDMLYLDKAWRDLQILTRPESIGFAARPAHRMFEGDVTMGHEWSGWEPWLRALRPQEIPGIVDDLECLRRAGVSSLVRARARVGPDPEREIDYVCSYFDSALEFATALRDDRRGMVYMIG